MKTEIRHIDFEGRTVYERVIGVFFDFKPIEDLKETVHLDFMGYGTAAHECLHERKLLLEMAETQSKQLRNLNIKINRKLIQERFLTAGAAYLIVEEFDMHDQDNDHHYTMRLSAILEKFEEKWLLIHFHGSTPDSNIAEEEALPMEGLRKKNRELEKKIKERTREVEIEVALERVRAVAMGMDKPQEMLDVCRVISDQLQQFGVEHIRNVQTVIINEEKGTYHNYQYFTAYKKESVEITEYHKNPVVLELANRMLESAVGFFTGTLTEKKLADWRSYRKQEDQFPDPLLDETDSMDYHFYSIGSGGLGLTLYRPLNKEGLEIFKRFHNVFSLAYRRFRDIEQAETQAQESEIQLALERVRARSIAMHKSSELADLSLELVKQVHALSINTWFCAFNIYDDDPKGSLEWGSNAQSTFPQYRTPREGIFLRYFEAGQQGETFLINEIGEKECPGHYDYLCSLPGVGDQLLKMKDGGISFPTSQIDHVAYFKYGYIIFITFEPVPEAHDIFKRFASVFEQTYIRFLDLEKAEQQAYESKVEASLERVRGMAASMNHSDDLMQIAEAMFMELEILHINPLRYGLGMINGKKRETELWASTVDDGRYLDMLGTISLTWHPMLQQVFDAWDAQHEEIIYELKGKELSDYYQKMGQLNPDIPKLDQLQDPDTDVVQFASFFPFKSGVLYAFTRNEPSEDGKSILKRFAHVYEQAHIRFNDLQKTELQALLIREERDRLEIALKELEATKDQLVQQEKLASLGQLTAGIAHEIKNPLNFVNNFSEVSLELVEEVREEVRGETDDRGPGNEKEENPYGARGDLILEILDDIEANLHKIHEHGSRADSIVKSMLQHSRGGSSKMEPTPLNPIIKEYVNLAFHGMRAGKEPINVEIELDFDVTIDEVPLIAEDFSRVILNVCNNAFDAMREKISAPSVSENAKGKSDSERSGEPRSEKSLRQPAESGEAERSRGVSSSLSYTPKLTVRTRSENGDVVIEIEDNGPGISDDIKDKILQPFFTTKKGTQGTGLGLSITNDIIKAHGGKMDMKSSQSGAVFFITLPS